MRLDVLDLELREAANYHYESDHNEGETGRYVDGAKDAQ